MNAVKLGSIALLVMFGMIVISAEAQAVSDDDDVLVGNDDPYSSTSDDGYSDDSGVSVQNANARNLRIGVMEVRSTFEAENAVSDLTRGRIFEYLQMTSEEINAAQRTVIPHNNVMKYLGPAEKSMYNKCWIDASCLAKALKASDLDLVVVSKLRMTAIGPKPEMQAGMNTDSPLPRQQAEYSLFIRLVDLRRSRVMAESLQTEYDSSKLPNLGQQGYRRMLVNAGLITDRPIGMVVPISTPDDADAIYKAPAPAKTRNLGLKVGAWTTLSLAAVSGALGLTFGVLSNKARDDAKKALTIQDLKDKDDQRETYMITSNVMYGLGGAFLVSSIVLFVLDIQDKGPETFGSGGGISVTPDGFFVQAQTRF